MELLKVTSSYQVNTISFLDRAIVPAAAKSLRAKGVRIFAIGVGNAIESELREIASEPYENHVIFIQGGNLVISGEPT